MYNGYESTAAKVDGSIHNLDSAGLAALVISAVFLSIKYWTDPNKPIAIAALFSFVGTAVLVAITAEYVRTNQRTLRLLELQWQKQNEAVVRFGLKKRNGKTRVWVVNLGRPNVMVRKVVIRTPEREPVSLYKHIAVTSGNRKFFDLPGKIAERAQLQQNVEVTLHYDTAEEQWEQSKAYTLFLEVGSHAVIKIKKGIHGLWPVGCPRCEKFLGICLQTDGLHSFDEAERRQTKLEAELRKTCPKHESKWMLADISGEPAEVGK